MIKLDEKTISYELFLPSIVLALREKVRIDEQLSDNEFKAMVAVVYRDAVIRMAKESRLMRFDIPIDAYIGVNHYDIVPPKGYYAESAYLLKEGNAEIPKGYFVNEFTLDLPCCPTKNVEKAWYLETAIVPKRTEGDCKYPAEFVERYYDPIFSLIMWRLSIMPNRTWSRKLNSAVFFQTYVTEKRQAMREFSNFSEAVKLKSRRFSDGSFV